MYYALRDEVSSDITDLLEKHGASKKKKNKEWKLTEELFGKVLATESKVAKKKEKDEQQKAVAAQVQMSENMRLLNERGQKIEELDDKARNLNQNAKNYGDMAKLLKEKTKRGAKGSKWLPF
jgi:dihydroxyacetone kinase